MLRSYGAPVPDGREIPTADEAKTAASELSGSGLGGQGADPRRRPRQGQVQGGVRRRQGRGADREVGRGRGAGGAEDARQHARHASDRRGGQVVNRVYVEDGSESPGALPGAAARPRLAPHRRSSARPKAAWTSRRSRRGPRRRSDLRGGPGLRLPGLPGRKSPSGSASRATRSSSASSSSHALPALHRDGLLDARDQPARRHRGRATCVPRRQDELRSTTRSSATPTSWRCAT